MIVCFLSVSPVCRVASVSLVEVVISSLDGSFHGQLLTATLSDVGNMKHCVTCVFLYNVPFRSLLMILEL